MSKVDWHAYLDGSLSVAERAEAERILQADSEARLRLENLKSFLAHVAAEGQAEEVPTAKLQAMIPKSASRAPFGLLRPAMVAVFCLVLLGALLWRPRTQAPASPRIEAIAATDPVVAERWILERTGLDAPMPSLASGKLVASERTATAGCYCLMLKGHMVHLAFTGDMKATQGMEPKDGFLVGNGMVAFKAKGLLWLVHGDEEKDVWSVAKDAFTKIQS